MEIVEAVVVAAAAVVISREAVGATSRVLPAVAEAMMALDSKEEAAVADTEEAAGAAAAADTEEAAVADTAEIVEAIEDMTEAVAVEDAAVADVADLTSSPGSRLSLGP